MVFLLLVEAVRGFHVTPSCLQLFRLLDGIITLHYFGDYLRAAP